jgi:tRNA (cmo5U34)-methyltransferase
VPSSADKVFPIALRERRYPQGRLRTPEPMAMDEPESVEQFHAGGAEAAGMQAVYDLNARALDSLVPRDGRLLDLGTGSGRALAGFLATRPDVRATCVDLAPNMLAEARRFLRAEGLGERVSLVEADLTALPRHVNDERWDAISCVWALHHLPDLGKLRAALGSIARLRERGGGAIWLFDFQRLRNPATMGAMLDVLEPDAPPVLRADALASEAAAFTQEELGAELAAAELGDLESGLARPIPWVQAFWGHPRSRTPREPTRRRPLSGKAGEEAENLRRNFSRLPR